MARSAALAVALLAGLVGAGCESVFSCPVSIVATPGIAVVGDRVPAGTVVVVAPADIDRSRTGLTRTVGQSSLLTIGFTPTGAERIATYTRAHIGDGIAVAVDDTVVVAATIMDVVADPALELALGDDATVGPLVACLAS
jgi:hypothetical protein